ncbi:hypothetical protein UFOVP49_103 [uncultured Caudovirales phage]|uniref:Uncharacterized protein n=1 Tax=uncultured Caudovirales phage TaxID=2100421 RepID=A0A6J5KT30_9CAUD|nr:hypothetical protein UFOVP49_103 [uncultured Caudovirales phage]
MQEVTVRNLKLNSDDIDAISFTLGGQDKSKHEWNFTMMKLTDREQDFVETDIGFKYQIVLYGTKTPEIFEAIIGDLEYYVKNLIKINQEGLILKKCKKSEEIMKKLFKDKYLQSLTNGLVEIAKIKE